MRTVEVFNAKNKADAENRGLELIDDLLKCGCCSSDFDIDTVEVQE
jgi:hypothetical protein